MAPVTPLFTLGDRFDTEVAIGDYTLPVHVKRFSRPENEAFEQQWDRFVTPRGTADLTAEEKTKFLAEELRFFETTIRDAITVEEGYIVDRDKPVTDGDGLIRVFHARKDVLGALVFAVFKCNRLGTVIRKNSKSPRASDTGSAASTPARGGAEQGSTADGADRSTTAASAPATDGSDAKPATSRSSGDRHEVH
jgi:hypothetical protein